MTEQSKTPLFDAVKEVHSKQVVLFGIPGHKYGVGLPEMSEYYGKRVLQLDVHENIKSLDRFPNPTGIIKEAQDLAAKAYNADRAFFLINGTSSGIMAMIMSVCKENDKIILARNVHKSAVAGLILSGAMPIYIQPEINQDLGIAMGITVEEIKKAIKEHPDAKAVLINNPTFYGAASDLKEIVKIAHENNIAVLVDEAHGAHLNFHEELPTSAMVAGADMCANSMHKTGGSLTQSSILFLKGNRISSQKVQATLNMMNSTSASFLLLASLDIARKQLATKGEEILTNALELARFARKEINKLDELYAYGEELIGTPGVVALDETKLGICVKGLGLTGFEVHDLLMNEYNIQVIMGDMYNIMVYLGIGNIKEDIIALIEAFKDIIFRYKKDEKINVNLTALNNPKVAITPRQAYQSEKYLLKLEECVGCISGETIIPYPPGIPIVTTGEIITEEIIDYLKVLKANNSVLHGCSDSNLNHLKVVKSE
ncbi:aminotransferase class I/II-fold pyridoxal phosphate-dependent enzyme [Clostridium ganghwense]|uniref:Aminotransferase class I/II-fold pyridoxal phosphate-dependent enzyme n=1 Tax=Clostridium ganghwense TaxID=312089 RepID=A0ABT4CSQ8_9CLOT|nr:aminotransferase class I/II-fold pyridoxal phosphate-dependent enzyme [Clostridium ganghwense]MCY6371458.1 aminotransferase class I/II-fold pyridoxal phosphate-dependent enzyme [Clostridium ganghwense]